MALALSLLPMPAFAASQPFVVTSFDGIRLNAPVRVTIMTGTGVSARGEGDRDTLDRLDLSMSGTLLVIRLRPPAPGAKAGGPVTLTLGTDTLRRVMLSGGGSIAIDRLKGLNADLVLAGSGDIGVGAVAVDRLGVTVSGSGRVTLAGTAGNLNIALSGPGSIEAGNLKAKDARLLAEGPGSATVTALTSADVTARGSGDVTVLGKPACKVSRGGTGTIRCGDADY